MLSKKYFEFVQPPATDADIKKLENALGAVIPSGFKAFLKKQNGADLKSSRVRCHPIKQTYTDVRVFFPISGNTNSILSYLNVDNENGQRFPGLMPVGGDSGGGVFRLSINPVDYDSVYFESESSELHKLAKIANSWNEFVSMIQLIKN